MCDNKPAEEKPLCILFMPLDRTRAAFSLCGVFGGLVRFSCRMTTFHKIMTVIWVTVGGVITWHYPDSVAWVALMSLYANVVGHWGAYQSARAEEKADASH